MAPPSRFDSTPRRRRWAARIARPIPSDSFYGYPFGGAPGRVSADSYWCDLGTVDAYYAADMDLLEPEPPIDLYQPDWRICGVEGQSPPARVVPGKAEAAV